jgi:aminoglycoside phosphotransferase (APT) family kinase protein
MQASAVTGRARPASGDTELEDRVSAFLRARLGERSDPHIHGFHRSAQGGSRENWVFTAEWTKRGERIERRLILRREQPFRIMEADHRREFDVLTTLHAVAPFPVPNPVWLETDPRWLDRPFIVLEQLSGRAEQGLLCDPDAPLDTRVELARQYAEIAGQLHGLDWRSAGLGFLGAPASAEAAADRAIERWLTDLRAGERPSPMLAVAGRWLRQHRPRHRTITLVHGDFRPANLLAVDGRITGVLDWEAVALSDPAEDVAWITLPTYYAREHLIPGVFGRDEFRSVYLAAGGPSFTLEDVTFWQVISALKLWNYSFARVGEAATRGISVGALSGRIRAWNAWYEQLLIELMQL